MINVHPDRARADAARKEIENFDYVQLVGGFSKGIEALKRNRDQSIQQLARQLAESERTNAALQKKERGNAARKIRPGEAVARAAGASVASLLY